MENKRRGILKHLPYLIYTSLIIILHIKMQVTGDDVTFFNLLEQHSINYLIKIRYIEWTSRVIIELILLVVLKIGYFFFKILNICMFVLLPYITNKLFNDDNNLELKWIICSVCFLIPTSCYGDAGWAATSINYLWTLIFGLIACIPIKKNFNNQKLTIYEKILTIISIIIASNQEQMAGILAICYTFTFIYNKIKKKRNNIIFINIVLIFISIIFIITCPGNISRIMQETEKQFPIYNSLNLIDKIQIGLIAMMKFISLEGRLVFIIITMIIMFAVFSTDNSKYMKIISIIPFIGSIPLNIMNAVLIPDRLIKIKVVINLFNKKNLVSNMFIGDNIFLYYFMIIYYSIILISMAISLYAIFKKTNKSIVAILLFGTGIISRIIMGFSPTVYASDERISIFLYVAFIMLIIYIWKHLKSINKADNSIKLLIISLSLISYIYNLWCIEAFQ